MQPAYGRPGISYAPSAQRVPYAPPGTARPPRADRGVGAKGPSQRAKARDRWSSLLTGPAYLEPGPSNRLVLSLRSCVPAEIDFALERIIQVASIDPDLLRLNELPGLLDGLVQLIWDYLDRRKHDRRGGAQSLIALTSSEPREVLRRRAAEASLVLRNLALEKKNAEPLLDSKRLRKVLVQVLEEGEFEGPEGEETTELRLYLLEILEIFGEHIPLAIPGHAIALASDADEDAPPPKPEPLDAPSVRLFPLLVALTRSEDRALIIAAYRCLTALSLNEKSDAVFALLAYEALPPLPKPHPHPVQTAIRLLPLADAELNTVVLDFIYQHTLLPSNAAYFCTRPELLQILHLVCSKFQIGAKEEQVETDIMLTRSEAATWYRTKYPVKPAGLSKKPIISPSGDALLSEAELDEIVRMDESDRTINWMHRMYEIDPDSDITQVSLWTAYKTQFETITMNPKIPTMLTAQDVIRLSGQAFPSAVPTILDDAEGRKFIIKGLKPRRRATLAGQCGWQDCPVPAGHDSRLAFHQHVYNTHLALPSPPTSCRWSDCNYTPTTPQTDPSLQIAQMTLHTRTHLPVLSSTPTAVSNPVPELPAAKLHHVRYHAQVDDHHEAAGPGFFACLILRNLTRAAKLARDATLPQQQQQEQQSTDSAATTGGRISVASGTAAIGRLAEGEQSIFEAFALAEEGSVSTRKGGVLNQIEKVDWTIAQPAIETIVGVLDIVLKTALSNVVLGKYLVEVVVTAEELRAGLQLKKNQVEEDQEMAL
ncbi:Rsc9p [Sporobolomyces koalae]|uniref:Rsc9p n=1 Tax=Sporobolomyces koalae TaxID=500713 RepID=UPI00317BA623